MRFALSFLLLCPVAAMALDLTPIPDEKVLEGVHIPRLRFKTTKGSVTWTPPAEWRMTYEDGRLLFLAKDYTHASFELRVIPRVAEDVEVLAKPGELVKYVEPLLPKTAKGIAGGGTNIGPFTINGIAAKEFLFDFQEPSHASRGSVSIVDLNERERLIVVISAQRKDFEAVRTIGIASMFSWQGE